MEDDELAMMTVTHFSYSSAPMLAMIHEDINGIYYMMEDPFVSIVHQGHMDL
jgi:hypothetical protein